MAINARALQTETSAATVDDVLSWLPSDTESLMVSQGPFEFVDFDELNRETEKSHPDTPAEVRIQLQMQPLEVAAQLLEGKVSKGMKGNVILFAAEASRHFRDPVPGSDVMDFEGCSIVLSREPLRIGSTSLDQQLLKRAHRTDTIAGTKVLIFDQSTKDAKAYSYFAQPHSNLTLVCNNRGFLSTTLERMQSAPTPRALPENLPEWNYIDRGATFWAIRHYDPSQAGEDATSPLREQTAQNMPDPKAIGVAFVVDAQHASEGRMIYLTGDDARVQADASKGRHVQSPEEGVEFIVTHRKLAPGVLELSYELNSNGAVAYYIFDVITSLGRGMYL